MKLEFLTVDSCSLVCDINGAYRQAGRFKYFVPSLTKDDWVCCVHNNPLKAVTGNHEPYIEIQTFNYLKSIIL